MEQTPWISNNLPQPGHLQGGCLQAHPTTSSLYLFYFFFAPLTCTHSIFFLSPSLSFLFLLHPYFHITCIHTRSEPISLAERAGLYKRRRTYTLALTKSTENYSMMTASVDYFSLDWALCTSWISVHCNICVWNLGKLTTSLSWPLWMVTYPGIHSSKLAISCFSLRKMLAYGEQLLQANMGFLWNNLSKIEQTIWLQ